MMRVCIRYENNQKYKFILRILRLHGVFFKVVVLLYLIFAQIGYGNGIVLGASLSNQEARNLYVYGKVYNLVRYFKPCKCKWNNLLISSLPNVVFAKNDFELVEKLNAFLKSFTPAGQVTFNEPKSTFEFTSRYYKSFVHYGYGEDIGDKYSSIFERIFSKRLYESKIKKVIPNEGPSFLYTAQLTDSLYITLPLFSDKKLISKDVLNEPLLDNSKYFQLADLIIIYGIVQHFYPYKGYIQESWDRHFFKHIDDALKGVDYTTNIQQFISKMNDGHAMASRAVFADINHIYGPDLSLVDINNKIFVQSLGSSIVNIMQGDEIYSVNGKPVVNLYRYFLTMSSAATDLHRSKLALNWMLLGHRDSVLYLQIVRNDSIVDYYLERKKTSIMATSNMVNTNVITLLDDGIIYIPGKIGYKEFKKYISQINTDSRIIIDLRTYPSIHPRFIGHFTESKVQSPKWLLPIITLPNYEGISYDTSGRWTLRPKKPFFENVVFLLDETSLSYTESLLGILEYYNIGTLIGRPSAGTNGNVAMADLLKGGSFYFSGLKVLKHDDSPWHGVGAIPDIVVKLTEKGLSTNKDPILEKAVEYLNNLNIQE